MRFSKRFDNITDILLILSDLSSEFVLIFFYLKYLCAFGDLARVLNSRKVIARVRVSLNENNLCALRHIHEIRGGDNAVYGINKIIIF